MPFIDVPGTSGASFLSSLRQACTLSFSLPFSAGPITTPGHMVTISMPLASSELWARRGKTPVSTTTHPLFETHGGQKTHLMNSQAAFSDRILDLEYDEKWFTSPHCVSSGGFFALHTITTGTAGAGQHRPASSYWCMHGPACLLGDLRVDDLLYARDDGHQ